jgi:hypothetical protein
MWMQWMQWIQWIQWIQEAEAVSSLLASGSEIPCAMCHMKQDCVMAVHDLRI